MRYLIHAVALLVFLVPGLSSAQDAATGPACRASLDGDQLTTTIEFSDGYAVEAPWHVTWNRSASLEDGSPGVAANARLDRIVEVKPGTKERVMTPFPEPIPTTFEGHTEQELAYRAAQIWCLTVLKAQGKAPNKSESPAARKKPVRTVG
jgi:hypothetical protein